MTRTLPAIDVGIEPLRELSGIGYPSRTAYVVFRPAEGEHHFASPLTPASFLTGCSDYDTASDELYCPCGVTLDWPDRMLGTAIEIADEHIVEAHPEATAKARAKRKREAKR